MAENMINVIIDGMEVEVPQGSTSLDAAEAAGALPIFECFDPDLRR